jgi:putative copper resistance protein D
LNLRPIVTGWVIVGVGALLMALAVGGGAPGPVPAGLPDAGPLVGWSLPVAAFLARLSAIAMIGMLVAAVFLLPGRSGVVEGLAATAVANAARCAWAWVASLVGVIVLAAADTAGEPLDELSFGTLWSFGYDTPLGRLILVEALAAAALAVVLRWTVSVRALAVVLVAAVIALVPRSWSGHSATGSHDLAAISLFVHVVAAALWMGGLLALTWVAVRGSKRLPAAVTRYATLALWTFAALAISGLANAAVRVPQWSDLASGYGALLVAKAIALIALGALGWFVRKRESSTSFARLAAVEVLIMAAAIGLAVALSRTPTPGGDLLSTPSEELLGGPMPAAPTWGRVLWGWEPTGVGVVIVLLGAALYIAGLVALRRRGDAWPLGRTVAWFSGLAVVWWAGVGGLSAYSHVLFSAHMGSHMALGMVAPILLVLGAPITLALRTLPGPRQPGEVSPRGLLLSLLHSRFVRFMTFPVVGPALFVGSLFVVYFSGLFDWLMMSMWGHAAMELHFLAVGALYYYVLIGVDPSPRTLPPIVRFGILMVTIPFHAFFSVALMSSRQVIAEPYWRVLDRPYRTDLLADQYLGGGISWAMGEVPLVLVFGALFVQWVRSDMREARRRDRAADRDADAELQAYNDYLKGLDQNPR